MASQQRLYCYKWQGRPRPGGPFHGPPRGRPDVVHQPFLLGQGDQRGAQEGPARPDAGLALRQSSIRTGRSLLCASLITLPEKEWLMYDVRTTTRRAVERTAGSRSSLPFVAIQTLLGSHVCRFRDSVSCPPATRTRSVMERTVYCTSASGSSRAERMPISRAISASRALSRSRALSSSPVRR